MIREYKCIDCPFNCIEFTIGVVYQLDDITDALFCNLGYPYIKSGGTIKWLNSHGVKFFEINKTFHINDIKSGMLVKFRNGKIAISLRDDFDNLDRFITIGDEKSVSLSFEEYDSINLTYEDDRYISGEKKDWDIIEVRIPRRFPDLCNYTKSLENSVLVWRDKPSVKMTMEEMKKKLEEMTGSTIEVI